MWIALNSTKAAQPCWVSARSLGLRDKYAEDGLYRRKSTSDKVVAGVVPAYVCECMSVAGAGVLCESSHCVNLHNETLLLFHDGLD
jgi:hypothetical protein